VAGKMPVKTISVYATTPTPVATLDLLSKAAR
jgi:hypothetical protein